MSEPKQLTRNEIKIIFPLWIKQRIQGCSRQVCYNKDCVKFSGNKKINNKEEVAQVKQDIM